MNNFYFDIKIPSQAREIYRNCLRVNDNFITIIDNYFLNLI